MSALGWVVHPVRPVPCGVQWCVFVGGYRGPPLKSRPCQSNLLLFKGRLKGQRCQTQEIEIHQCGWRQCQFCEILMNDICICACTLLLSYSDMLGDAGVMSKKKSDWLWNFSANSGISRNVSIKRKTIRLLGTPQVSKSDQCFLSPFFKHDEIASVNYKCFGLFSASVLLWTLFFKFQSKNHVLLPHHNLPRWCYEL